MSVRDTAPLMLRLCEGPFLYTEWASVGQKRLIYLYGLFLLLSHVMLQTFESDMHVFPRASTSFLFVPSLSGLRLN